MLLASPQALVLTPRNRWWVSPVLALDPLTAALVVRLQRPTTLTPLAWGVADVVRVSLVMAVDGREYRCEGRATGGVRLRRDGTEAAEYGLAYRPPVMFGERAADYLATAIKDAEGFYRNVPLTRIGETGAKVEGWVEIECLSGRVETAVLLATADVAPAPVLDRFKNSVAWDAATDAQEVSGDGVLSLSHTASGANRAAFAVAANAAGTPRTSTSTTYGGTGMTERWDISLSFWAQAGYTLANPATGAQTVTNTLSGATDEHALAVLTMTGVDGTTPVGTPVTATGFSDTPSVTVGSVGADDLVVDGVTFENTSLNVGADQTERTSETLVASWVLKTSTQPGTAGGVMSWSLVATSRDWTLGAIAFKPAGAAATSFLLRQGRFVPLLVR